MRYVDDTDPTWAAWAKAEEALPEGWYIQLRHQANGDWDAEAEFPLRPSDGIREWGATPLIALTVLAATLRRVRE